MARALGKRLALGAAAIALIAAAFWAGRITVQPVAVQGELPASEVLVDVTEQTVGRSLTMNVTVTQKKRAIAVNALAGVVTQVRPSGEVAVGDVLYTVGGVPVRAVAGNEPFYRALGPDDVGSDVQQLEEALVQLGRLTAADRRYGTATTKAVRAWQKDLGLPQTGTVALGELVASPELPGSVVMDAEVASPGLVLIGGEKIVSGAVGLPEFALRLSRDQARLVPKSSLISMDYQDHAWQAVITGSENNDMGETIFSLAAPGGGPVCGEDCGAVTADQEISILAKVAITPPATGPAVPVAAITTAADGTASVLVVDDAGTRTRRTVTVVGSHQDGIAVVEGVQVGERVQVLAGPSVPEPSATGDG